MHSARNLIYTNRDAQLIDHDEQQDCISQVSFNDNIIDTDLIQEKASNLSGSTYSLSKSPAGYQSQVSVDVQSMSDFSEKTKKSLTIDENSAQSEIAHTTRRSQVKSHKGARSNRSETTSSAKLRSASVAIPSHRSKTLTRTASSTRYKFDTQDSSPLEETASYQGLDLSNFPSNFLRRPFRRRAVIVGINYVSTPDILLRGCCNDAVALAKTLINIFDFLPEEIVLLIDAFPAECYRCLSRPDERSPGEAIPWRNRQPARRNILMALNWLRADTLPGDVLLFFFAGHGIQVDDMSGWEGEGYDEAILPMDFCGEEINAITAVMIRNVLLNVSNDVQVTIILDCNGGQTMLDPSGTGNWKFIKGVKQRGVWPFITDATDKVARAVYDPTAWSDKAMKRRGARPRFIPGVDVSSTQELLDPVLQKPSSQVVNKVKGYLFAAAPHSQSAIEAKMSALRIQAVDRNNNIINHNRTEKSTAYHGVFTWCLITALQDLIIQAVETLNAKSVSYRRLGAEVERRVKLLRTPQGGLPKLNQASELTFYRSGGSDTRDYFLWPFGGRRPNVPYLDSSYPNISLPLVPYEQHFLSVWDAEEQLKVVGENKRRNDPAFIRSATLSNRNPLPYDNHPTPASLSTNLGFDPRQHRMSSSPLVSMNSNPQMQFPTHTEMETPTHSINEPLHISPQKIPLQTSLAPQDWASQGGPVQFNPGMTHRSNDKFSVWNTMPTASSKLDAKGNHILAQHGIDPNDFLEAASKGQILLRPQLKVSTMLKPTSGDSTMMSNSSSYIFGGDTRAYVPRNTFSDQNLYRQNHVIHQQDQQQQQYRGYEVSPNLTPRSGILPMSNLPHSAQQYSIEYQQPFSQSSLPSPSYHDNCRDIMKIPMFQSNMLTQRIPVHYAMRPGSPHQAGQEIKRSVVHK